MGAAGYHQAGAVKHRIAAVDPARVYRGTDELLGRPVAIKMFNLHLTDPVMLTRQHQEMRVVAGLHQRVAEAVQDVSDQGVVGPFVRFGELEQPVQGWDLGGRTMHSPSMRIIFGASFSAYARDWTARHVRPQPDSPTARPPFR